MAKPRRKPAPKEWSRTFQLRLKGERCELDDMAARYGVAKRKTYGQAKLRGCTFDDLKVEISNEFSLPSRTFNAIAKDLRGMVKSRQEKSALEVDDLAYKLEQTTKAEAKARTQLAKAIANKNSGWRRKSHSMAVHKKESSDRLRARLNRARLESEAPFPSICFGSHKLFNAQHHREANGYESHDAWLEDWRSARNDQFIIIGSEDEPSGNKTCRGTVNADGTVGLKLLLTKEDAEGSGRSIVLEGLRLPYGHDVWVAAIEAGDEEARRSAAWQKATAAEVDRLKADGLTPEAEADLRKQRKADRKKQPKVGAAIAYRFVRDGYGWRILVTVTKAMPKFTADFSRGALGVDLNDGFVSRTRTDNKGSFVDSKDLALTLRGLTSGQRLAAIHDLADRLVKEAVSLGMLPIVIEWLNFTMKKRRLNEVGCAAASRRLSSFAYAKFAEILKSHARLHGICVVEVNPAFTSIIGAAVHAVPLGLSVHGAAALAIARRGMGVEETIPDAMRVWHPHRAPLPMRRPDCLRRKAPVDPAWEGWMELQNAVHAARDAAKYVRPTGKQRRYDLYLVRAAEIPW